MQARLLICAAFLLVGCQRSLDERLLGRWHTPGTSMELAFRSDHTFTLDSDRTWSGTWHTQADQLVMVTESEHGEQTDTHDIQIRGDEIVFRQHTRVQKRGGTYFGEPRTDDGGAVYKRVR